MVKKWFSEHQNFFKKFALVPVAAIIWTIALLYSQNILFFNPHWESSYAVTGGLRTTGLDSILSRQTLSRNKLNPGNHGLRQKVITRKDFDWKKISLTTQMNPFSFFDLGIQTDKGSRGIRISSHHFFPSMVFEEDHSDSFIHVESFKLEAQGRNLDVDLERNGSIFIDGKKVYSSASPFPPGKIEIRVSNASISDVSVHHPQEEKLSFVRNESFWKYFFIHLLVIAGISAFVSYKVPLFIFLLGIIWTGFDYSYYSQKHFKLNQTTLEYKSPESVAIDPENLRHNFFKSWFHILGGETVSRSLLESRYEKRIPTGVPLFCDNTGCSYVRSDEIDGKKKNDEFRIFVVGGSLTDGWGVARPEKTSYPVHLQRNLTGKKQVSILTSISPFISFYRHLDPKDNGKLMNAFRPDLILLDVSPRFTDLKEFSEFLTQLRKSNIPVVAFIAPVDIMSAAPEFLMDAVAGNPPDVREDEVSPLMRKSGVITLDPQVHFLNPKLYLKNNLFVDHSHLTDSGHRELGLLLAEEIRSIIPLREPKPSHHR